MKRVLIKLELRDLSAPEFSALTHTRRRGRGRPPSPGLGARFSDRLGTGQSNACAVCVPACVFVCEGGFPAHWFADRFPVRQKLGREEKRDGGLTTWGTQGSDRDSVRPCSYRGHAGSSVKDGVEKKGG